jgi:MoaA/NifB/PqqE/SkfB family radical SAM enzyme
MNVPLTTKNPAPATDKKSTQDSFMMGGHKLHWHLDRVHAWQQGERIAPVHIDVGLSKGCNIKCNYCYGVTQGNFFTEGAKRYFPGDALIQYMKDAGEIGVRSMALIGEAEPTLNPRLYDAIVAGKKAGVDISIGTNGILFDAGKKGEEALEHLSWIRFNISAGTEEGYQRIHNSKGFKKACKKIRFCVETKRRNNLDVTVGLQMVLTPENADQVIPLAQLGQELGVDYLVVKQCSDTVDNDLGIYSRLNVYSSFTEMLQAAEEYGNDAYKVIIKWAKISNEGHRNYDNCLGVPFLLYSSGDGKMFPCGMFFDKRSDEFLMGDMTKQSFKEIWESDRYWDVVKRVENVMEVHSECYANCRTHEINEFLWKIKDVPPHVNFA